MSEQKGNGLDSLVGLRVIYHGPTKRFYLPTVEPEDSDIVVSKTETRNKQLAETTGGPER